MIEITVLGTIGEFIVGKTSRGVVVINTCGIIKTIVTSKLIVKL